MTDKFIAGIGLFFASIIYVLLAFDPIFKVYFASLLFSLGSLGGSMVGVYLVVLPDWSLRGNFIIKYLKNIGNLIAFYIILFCLANAFYYTILQPVLKAVF